MAIHALWEDRYALSVRKCRIDLSDLTDTAYVAASHNNEGDATTNGGADHFSGTVSTIKPDSNYVEDGGANSTGIIGIPVEKASAPWPADGNVIYGMPVIGNPGISVNQDTIEVQKTDGFATQRVGGDLEASDIFRAGQAPSAAFDVVATGKTIVHMAALFFQNGIKESGQDGSGDAADLVNMTPRKIMRLPSNTDGSEPLYYGTFLRKISAGESNSHILSDGIASSLSFRASQTEPLTVSTTLNGRIMSSDFEIDADVGANQEDTIFGLDGNRNYLLQDSIITFQADDESTTDTNSDPITIPGQDIILPCESFDINLTAEVTPNKFNTFFPINMVLGNYTVEGSFTIPMLGKGSTPLDYEYFVSLIADAGITGASTKTSYKPRMFSVNWMTTEASNPGDTISFLDGALTAGNGINFKSTTLAATVSSAATVSIIVWGDYSNNGNVQNIDIETDNGGVISVQSTNAAVANGRTTFTIPSTNFTNQRACTGSNTYADRDKGNIVRIGTRSPFDLSLRCNAIITDCTIGGATEATMTVSFRAMNKFLKGTDSLLQDAFYAEFYDDIQANGADALWGYNPYPKLAIAP